MQNKIIKIGLVLASIILLMSTTQSFVATRVNENIQPSIITDYGNNSLGTLIVRHQPLFPGYIFHQGLIVADYIRPDNNFKYQFDVVDGKFVNMNFSLTVTHVLNPSSNFYLPRHTWIKNLWIAFPDGSNVFFIDNKSYCYSLSEITYWVNFTNESQLKDVPWDGQDVILKYWLYVMPAATNNSAFHNFMTYWWKIKKDGLKPIGGSPIDITIQPKDV